MPVFWDFAYFSFTIAAALPNVGRVHDPAPDSQGRHRPHAGVVFFFQRVDSRICHQCHGGAHRRKIERAAAIRPGAAGPDDRHQPPPGAAVRRRSRKRMRQLCSKMLLHVAASLGIRGYFRSKHRHPSIWTASQARHRRRAGVVGGKAHIELAGMSIQQFGASKLRRAGTATDGSNKPSLRGAGRCQRRATAAAVGRQHLQEARAPSARDTASLRYRLSWRMTPKIQSAGMPARLAGGGDLIRERPRDNAVEHRPIHRPAPGVVMVSAYQPPARSQMRGLDLDGGLGAAQHRRPFNGGIVRHVAIE